MKEEKPIILFDGVCNLCSSAVQFVIKHDKKKQFLFSSLQSDFGQKTLKTKGLETRSFDSFILLHKGETYYKSSAALHVNKLLGGFISITWVLIIIPPFIRNTIYSIIAKNRYKWFGKKEECWIPTPELKSRFI